VSLIRTPVHIQRIIRFVMPTSPPDDERCCRPVVNRSSMTREHQRCLPRFQVRHSPRHDASSHPTTLATHSVSTADNQNTVSRFQEHPKAFLVHELCPRFGVPAEPEVPHSTPSLPKEPRCRAFRIPAVPRQPMPSLDASSDLRPPGCPGAINCLKP
jgi:hypothetical protein